MLSSRHFLSRPNPRVDVVGDGTTTLTYALQTDPTPLTASIPDVPQTLGTLKLVITNPLDTPVGVSAIGLTLQMGTDAADFGTTTDGSGFSVSDIVNWSVTPPSEIVTDGPALWVVGPSGDSVDLAAGASIVVELIEIPINLAIGTTTLAIVENLADGTGGQTSFDITKFPYGFYFERLIATVPQGSQLVPVAQVANGTPVTPVTLLWNSSVTTPSAFTVLYATNAGQQTGSVTTAGEWTSPTPLASDTVFVVQVKVTGEGGESLTFALATAVSVQNPDVVASTVAVANTLAVTGATTLSGGAVVGGTLSAGTANVGALTVSGTASAAGLNVSGPATLSGGLNAQAASPYAISASSGDGNAGTFNNQSAQYPALYCSNSISAQAPSCVSGVYAQVASGTDWGVFTNGQITTSAGAAAFTHLQTRRGHSVVTSPLTLEVEIHLSGAGTLSAGRGTVAFGPDVEDVIAHGEGYRVQLTPVGECQGLCVTAKRDDGFDVAELRGGTACVGFDWFVVARKRRALGEQAAHAMPQALPTIAAPPSDGGRGPGRAHPMVDHPPLSPFPS